MTRIQDRFRRQKQDRVKDARDEDVPVAAGEVMGTLTYFQENGEAAVYDLVAARSVAVRENVPKTLEQIIAETYADPNPFPPFTIEVALILFGPVLILGLLILLIHLLRKWLRSRGRRTPKPVSRYLK